MDFCPFWEYRFFSLFSNDQGNLLSGIDNKTVIKMWNFNLNKYVLFSVNIKCLMVSTDHADPSCFYFRISWIMTERRWFYSFCPLHLVQGLRSLRHWLLQKLNMTLRFLIKKQVILCSNISVTWIFWPL